MTAPWLRLDRDNPQVDGTGENQAELHMHPGEYVTVIGPTGDELEIWVEDNQLKWRGQFDGFDHLAGLKRIVGGTVTAVAEEIADR